MTNNVTNVQYRTKNVNNIQRIIEEFESEGG
jgi:hypothetical protein